MRRKRNNEGDEMRGRREGEREGARKAKEELLEAERRQQTASSKQQAASSKQQTTNRKERREEKRREKSKTERRPNCAQVEGAELARAACVCSFCAALALAQICSACKMGARRVARCEWTAMLPNRAAGWCERACDCCARVAA